MPGTTRKSTSMSIDGDVLDEARRLGINLSQAAQNGLVAAIRAERTRIWREENAAAVSDYNDFIETRGVPLGEFRKF